jgi:alcohol dehydrogenase YqhD (iron-dependent ADH family)
VSFSGHQCRRRPTSQSLPYVTKMRRTHLSPEKVSLNTAISIPPITTPAVLSSVAFRFHNETSTHNMDSFEWTGILSKVIFGAGKIETLPDILSSMNLNRCMILTTPKQHHLGDLVATLIGEKAATAFHQATMHTPLHVTEQAMKVAKEAQVDSTISIGGGSTTGLGKAIAIRLGIPQICIPTTYAGSEMTPTLGETVNGKKTTRRDEAIRPNVVIYDVDLTLKLPVRTSLTSGMNAIAHAGEFSHHRMVVRERFDLC